MSISQANHFATLETPLGADTLIIRDLTYAEALGRLFEINLRLISEDPNVKFADIVGQSVTITLHFADDKTRTINGVVRRFVQTELEDRFAHYEASVVPWLWFLTRSADCRIFQSKSIPDIIKEVFDDLGFSDYKFSLSGSFEPWDYCVQYRETAFNFVSRLMEQEGMYYFFEHSDGKHTLVVANDHGAHEPFSDCEKLPYNPAAEDFPGLEAILDWKVEQHVQPGTCAVNDFNFETPKAALLAKSNVTREHTHADGEIYDYPGEYGDHGEGDTYARLRIEELQSMHEIVTAHTNAGRISAGYLLSLEEYPRADQNKEYLITEVQYEIRNRQPESGPQNHSVYCHCRFKAIDSATPFRSARLTPKPIIQGPQTAIVVGPSGEEIHTDKYGRVKVQFHWDRYGNADENSSCWVRVSQLWAGKAWGAMHIPRMGQEVIVEFLEGDPDRPIITGRVYNADCMPPFGLPGNKTQSGVKSRSSLGGGGGNFNEIRFEDKSGSEQLFIHAEKNQDIEVENDETHWVGHDRKKTIDHDETTQVKHDRTETVDNDETITIHGNRTETVDKDEKITIHQNRTEKVDINEDITIGSNRTEKVGSNESIDVGADRTRTVGSNESVTVGVSRTHTVGVNEAITIGAAQEITVGAAQMVKVGAAQQISVGANQSTDVGINQSNSVGNNQGNDVGGNRTTTVKKNDTLSVTKKLAIDAGEEILIKTGDASILMKKDGTIQIKGKDITIKGSGKITVKADSDVTIKGSKIGAN